MEYETNFNEYLDQSYNLGKIECYSDLWTEWHDGGDDRGWSETNPNF